MCNVDQYCYLCVAIGVCVSCCNVHVCFIRLLGVCVVPVMPVPKFVFLVSMSDVGCCVLLYWLVCVVGGSSSHVRCTCVSLPW